MSLRSPTPDEASGLFDGLVLGGSGIYLGFALLVGTVRGLRLAVPVIALPGRREADGGAGGRAVLRLPLVLPQACRLLLWGDGALVFGGMG